MVEVNAKMVLGGKWTSYNSVRGEDVIIGSEGVDPAVVEDMTVVESLYEWNHLCLLNGGDSGSGKFKGSHETPSVSDLKL